MSLKHQAALKAMRINNDYRKTIRHAKWVQKLGLARGFAVMVSYTTNWYKSVRHV